MLNHSLLQPLGRRRAAGEPDTGEPDAGEPDAGEPDDRERNQQTKMSDAGAPDLRC
ncbi:MAG TPA: hypothetical protein VFN08_15315 [Gemmatimonadales bacterium]|nr:hypothetical protein [Gemmatimonadales bacterium]